MAMIIPSAMSGFMHYRRGNVMFSIIPYLIAGSGDISVFKLTYKASGAWFAGYYLAKGTSETQTRIAYCIAMAFLAFLTLKKPPKPLRVPSHLVKGVKSKGEKELL
jgi:hypothetical protein